VFFFCYRAFFLLHMVSAFQGQLQLDYQPSTLLAYVENFLR
jgi:hypothetical protein